MYYTHLYVRLYCETLNHPGLQKTSDLRSLPVPAPQRNFQVLHGVFHHGKDHAIQDTAITAQVALQVGVEDIYIGPANALPMAEGQRAVSWKVIPPVIFLGS